MLEVVRVFPGISGASTSLLRAFDGSLVVRKSAHGNASLKLEAQAEWYRRGDFKLRTPRLLQAFRRDGEFTLELEYLQGAVSLHQELLRLPEDLACELFMRVIESLCRVHARRAVIQDTLARDQYLQDKIIGKVQWAASRHAELDRLVCCSELSINGKTYPGYLECLDRIQADEAIMDGLARYRPSPLHGDLTLQNILVSGDTIYFIDPNDGNSLGTPLVDFGKLLQSLDSGYEFLLNCDSFGCEGNSVRYDGHLPARWKLLKRLLLERLAKDLSPMEMRQLDFHQAAHLARLLPYQLDWNRPRVVLFFAECVRKLNEFIEAEKCA